jgi:hypothetical protein
VGNIQRGENKPLAKARRYVQAAADVVKELIEGEFALEKEDQSALHLADGGFLIEEGSVVVT